MRRSRLAVRTRVPENRFRTILGLELLDSRAAPSSVLDPYGNGALEPVQPVGGATADLDNSTQATSPATGIQVLTPAASGSGGGQGSVGLPSGSAATPLPATGTDTVSTDIQPVTGTNPTEPKPQPPQIINFQIVQSSSGMYQVSGDVVDSSPSGLVVQFGGTPVSLQGLTATTDGSGHFCVYVALNTNGSDDGTATAVTTDNAGLTSNTATYVINP